MHVRMVHGCMRQEIKPDHNDATHARVGDLDWPPMGQSIPGAYGDDGGSIHYDNLF
jgi:hypothetical protein